MATIKDIHYENRLKTKYTNYFDILPDKCIICKCQPTDFLVYECIHRPSIKDRTFYGYNGRKCYIKIHSCYKHKSHIYSLMKDRIIVASDINVFRHECIRILGL